MPTYDYACGQCGSFDALRSVAMRNQDAACPSCGGVAPRVLASAPALATAQLRPAPSVRPRAIAAS
mgnify:CR=1 FL=1